LFNQHMSGEERGSAELCLFSVNIFVDNSSQTPLTDNDFHYEDPQNVQL